MSQRSFLTPIEWDFSAKPPVWVHPTLPGTRLFSLESIVWKPRKEAKKGRELARRTLDRPRVGSDDDMEWVYRGDSSAGRASRSQCEGREFESHSLHLRFINVFLGRTPLGVPWVFDERLSIRQVVFTNLLSYFKGLRMSSLDRI